MRKIYENLKGKELKTPLYSGIVCGCTDNHLVLATLDRPDASFRKFDNKKEVFLEEDFKDPIYKYIYADERNFKK